MSVQSPDPFAAARSTAPDPEFAVVGVRSVRYAAAPMLAHHSFAAEYDARKPVKVSGTVTKMEWMNPHARFYVDVKDDSGKAVNWTIETLAPAVLKRAGWSRETLHAGNQITITLVPSKKGTPVGMLRKVVLPDGSELTGGSLGEQPPQ